MDKDKEAFLIISICINVTIWSAFGFLILGKIDVPVLIFIESLLIIAWFYSVRSIKEDSKKWIMITT